MIEKKLQVFVSLIYGLGLGVLSMGVWTGTIETRVQTLMEFKANYEAGQRETIRLLQEIKSATDQLQNEVEQIKREYREDEQAEQERIRQFYQKYDLKPK